MIPKNEKQKAWQEAIDSFGKKNLIVLETGRIRNPDWKVSDGDSTNYFTDNELVDKLISIDNDSENFSGYDSSEKYCKASLTPSQLSRIEFINGHSVSCIENLQTKLDVVLLDSANDSELIFQEFMSVLPKLNEESLIIVDDVSLPGVKGDKIISLLNKLNMEFTLKEASPSDCIYFFLNTEKIKQIILNR